MNLQKFFKILVLSFYAPSLYIAVASKWKHWGLGFLLRFSILVSFTTSRTLFILISMINFNQDSIRNLLNQIPEMKIYQDKASFLDESLKSPIYIGSSKNMIVIDLDSKTAEKYPQNLLTFSGYEITLNIFKSSPFTISYNDFLEGRDVKIINTENLLAFLFEIKKKILGIILVLGISLGSIIYFVLSLIKSLFYASIASICAGLFKLNLDFKQLTRLAVMANAPSFIISTGFSILFFGNQITDIEQFLASSIYLLYFLGGIIICIKAKREGY